MACGPATPAPTSAAGALTASGVNEAAASSTPSADASATAPADRLAAAFAGLSGGYTYHATVTVGSNTVSTATGRSVGGASEFTLTTNGASVVYRAIPPKGWVQKVANGPWVEVVGRLPPGNPIAALTTPTATSVVSDAPDALVIDATYPASTLGLSGTAPTTVRLSVASDGSITAAYQATVGSDQATSSTVFQPSTGLAPIIAP